jgi:hypothetical protein
MLQNANAYFVLLLVSGTKERGKKPKQQKKNWTHNGQQQKVANMKRIS